MPFFTKLVLLIGAHLLMVSGCLHSASLLYQIGIRSTFDYGVFVSNRLLRHVASYAIKLPIGFPRLFFGIFLLNVSPFLVLRMLQRWTLLLISCFRVSMCLILCTTYVPNVLSISLYLIIHDLSDHRAEIDALVHLPIYLCLTLMKHPYLIFLPAPNFLFVGKKGEWSMRLLVC